MEESLGASIDSASYFLLSPEGRGFLVHREGINLDWVQGFMSGAAVTHLFEMCRWAYNGTRWSDALLSEPVTVVFLNADHHPLQRLYLIDKANQEMGAGCHDPRLSQLPED